MKEKTLIKNTNINTIKQLKKQRRRYV